MRDINSNITNHHFPRTDHINEHACVVNSNNKSDRDFMMELFTECNERQVNVAVLVFFNLTRFATWQINVDKFLNYHTKDKQQAVLANVFNKRWKELKRDPVIASYINKITHAEVKMTPYVQFETGQMITASNMYGKNEGVVYPKKYTRN